MIKFKMPPKLASGNLEINGETLELTDFAWADFQHPVSFGDEFQTSVGKAKLGDGYVWLHVGYKQSDRLPSYDIAVSPEIDIRKVNSTFTFEEVQQ